MEDAYAMFLDISGFTTITESLMKHDEEGIEVISDILNALFSPVIDIIDKHNGFIAQFAGDAVTAVFPSHKIDTVIQCGDFILSYINKLSIKTSVGVFNTNAKIGIAQGSIQWGVCGYDYRAYYFRGNAIDRSADAQLQARNNEIILKSSLNPESSKIRFERIKKDIFRITHIAKENSHNKNMGFCNDNDIESQFFPLHLMPESQWGEFRNIVSVFLSLPEYEHSMMNVLIDHMLSMLNQWGGYLSSVDFGDKGAKAVIFFGMPRSYENNVKRSLGFLTDIMKEFGSTLKAGVSYGKCYAGMIGDSRRATYTAIGDKVNTAARLMGIAKPGQIMIDGNIYSHVLGNYAMEHMGRMNLKGKKSRENVYILGEEKRQIPQQLTSFTGRTEEKKQLKNHIDDAIQNGHACLISVVAEAGQGKTRLIEHVLDSLDRENPVIRMKAEDIIKKSYNSIIDMIERILELPDNAEHRMMRFREQNLELINNLPRQRQEYAARYESVLAALLGIFWNGSLYEKLDSNEIEQMTHQAIALFIECMAGGLMPVMFIDDFQWIDNDTRKFVHFLMEESGLQVCLIAGSRISQRQIAEEIQCTQHTVELKSMSKKDTEHMAQNILNKTVSSDFNSFIYERSGGNPFYTEQFVKYLNENGHVIENKGIMCLKKNIKGIPMKLSTVISSRIDNLNTHLKRTVFAASVLGSEFRDDYIRNMLHSIYGFSSEDAKTSVTDGISKNIWEISGQLKYLFTHILLRDTAYGMMLGKDLKILHLKAARIILKLSAHDKRMYPDAAYHFEQSGEYERAYEYYEKAGDYYDLLYNYEEAIKYYGKCINIAKRQFKQRDIRLGKAYLNYGMSIKETGKYREALTALIEAANIFKNSKKAAVQGEETLNIIGACHWNLGEYEKSLSFHRKAIRKCRALYGENHKETAATYNDIGMVYWSNGNYKIAYRNMLKSLKIREKLGEGNEEDIADSYNSLGTLFLQMSRYSESLDYLLKSIDMLENTLGHEHHKTGIGYNNIGVTYFYLNEYEKAIDALKQSLAILEKLYSENHPSTALTISNIGGLYNKTGNLEKAEEYIGKSLELFREIYGDEHPNVALSYNNLGKLHHNLGKHDRAKECHEKALNIRLKILGEKHYDTGLSLREMAYCLIEEAQYSDAEDHLKRAMSIFRSIGGDEHIDTGITARMYSILLIKQKRNAEAKDMLKRALNAFSLNNDIEGVKNAEETLKQIEEEP